MAGIQKKICMLGAYSVGKTSLVQRYVQGIFDEKYLTTVGVKIDRRQTSVDGTDLNFLLWDIAGEDDYFEVPLSYLRGAHGYFVVIDVTRKSTLEAALNLRERALGAVGDAPFVFLVNKTDLEGQFELEPDEIDELGARFPVLRTSAKTGKGVEQAFEELGRAMLGASEKK